MTEDVLAYQTFERKIVYAFSILNNDGKLDYYNGLEKIGDTSITDFKIDARDDSDDLISVAEKRIKQYAGTSGLPYKVDISRLAVTKENKFFRDYDVHRVLQRSGIKKAELDNGNEWYRTDVPTIIKAIEAVEEGRNTIDSASEAKESKKIIFRPEQEEAIKQTTKVLKNKPKMLWNAKMRFGKTLSALQVIKDNGFKKSLIITHRPVVSDGWFEDFNKIFSKNDGYLYGSKTTGEKLKYLKNGDKSFVYFASMQDLRGLAAFGGIYNTENKAVADVDWDFIIVDEAHEGTRTEIARNVLDIISKDAKVLELSGTPFNILDDYLEDQVFTWDYVMEQEAKQKWSENYPYETNPYESLPKVNMYTFEIQDKFKDAKFISTEDKAFNFMEFFKTKDDKFVYETKVNTFLDEITRPDSKTNYPFSTLEFRNSLRHTLWLLPSVASCNALKELLDNHSVFRNEYKVINIVDDGKEDGANASDLKRVRNAITDKPSETKTITLSVRKLTTGVNIPEWTGVVFLNNTNSPSAYLQAAFRAQTPFYDEEMGMKSNAYIFDFAPDRALTIMTSAAKLNSGVGKITTNAQREQMQKFINFLPILGETGNGMQVYDVNSLLTKLKKVYAEKAVRMGFEDDSLYNDELLTLTDVDLKDFKDLKAIVNSTNNKKMKEKIDVNQQGLTEEEYEKSEKAKKKKSKERTPEEIEAMAKVKAAKKQRNTMISILRGISIRIPMMIYGMDLDIDIDVDINRFVDEVDNVSWSEFMPKGVTKLMFKRYAKYYDPEVFIEAGRIIRNRAKSFDELEYSDRTEKIAQLFSTFKNPDKETVLTPWRVVNLQLSKTIGGLCYLDESFEQSAMNGSSTLRWVDTDITDNVFKDDTKILEINSKTGLYPLYAATSLFYKKRNELNTDRAGNFNKYDEERIIQEVLNDNIFVIAKTPMAKTITQKTLAGYKNWHTNIKYIENLTSELKDNITTTTKMVQGELNNMKFDVIIGNPPYQEETTTSEMRNGQQKRVRNVFQDFQRLADNISSGYSILIYPAGRWIHRSGKGMKEFGLSQINSTSLSKLYFYPKTEDIFRDVGIADGISIVLKDYKKTTNRFEYIYCENGIQEVVTLQSPGEKLIVLNPFDAGIVEKIESFVEKYDLTFLSESSVINQKLFQIESDFAEINPTKVRLYSGQKFDFKNEIKLFTNDKAGKTGRSTWFLADRDSIKVNKELINEWQVVVSSANAGGKKRANQIEIIDNYSAFGRSRLALKSFKTEIEANNFYKYAKSYLIRFAFLMSDEAISSLAKKVPDLLDYTDKNRLIDFSKDIDNQLSSILKLTDKEINYIKDRVDNIR